MLSTVSRFIFDSAGGGMGIFVDSIFLISYAVLTDIEINNKYIE
jgi:hypothetical protein